jgi:hypothetical protein
MFPFRHHMQLHAVWVRGHTGRFVTAPLSTGPPVRSPFGGSLERSGMQGIRAQAGPAAGMPATVQGSVAPLAYDPATTLRSTNAATSRSA